MKKIEYTAEVLSDGHLSIPESIRRKLRLKVHSKLRVSVLPTQNKNKGLARFCGKWQDDLEADEIIEEIYRSRNQNIRSEGIEL